jgi:hypothetical protein
VFFSKPVTALTYEDIESLTLTGEPESLVLDYKERVEGGERDKKELAKDVSAMANSSGGYVVIGVEEKQGKPVHPPCGTSRMIGRQKVEEWIEQILISNVAQRPPSVIRVVDLPGNADKCVVVINTSVSSRTPHMVTVDHRYFKRHEFQSVPAEEYEVREMFERAGRLRSETEEYLASRNYLHVTSSSFAENGLSRHLYMSEATAEASEPEVAQSFVTFLSCPDTLMSDALDVFGDEVWQWLEPALRLYPPPGGFLLPLGAKRMVSDGILLFEEYESHSRSFWDRYLFVARNGFVEIGLSRAQRHQRELHFPLVEIVGRFWQFLGLVTDLYKAQGLLRPFRVMLNIKGTAGSTLWSLGEGWPVPGDYRAQREHPPTCLEPNLQFILNMRDPDAEPDDIERCVREIAAQIDAAYGSRDLRCFNHPRKDPSGSFPRHLMWS